MMKNLRTIALLLLPLPLQVFGLDATVIITPESALTNTVQVHPMHFDCGAEGAPQGTLPAGKWAAPWVAGSKLAVWQVDQESWCSNGSLQYAMFSYVLTTAGPVTVQFRADDNPCSSGNRAACDAAGLTQSGMLAFNGGTWTASATFTPTPLGSATAHTFDARARLTAGDWRYILRGPAMTQVMVGGIDTARTLSFGWKQHHIAYLTVGETSLTATSFTVNDASQWSGISRPFEVSIGHGSGGAYENVLVCFVSGNILYVGNSNGSDASCANVNGRAASGTSAQFHTLGADGSGALVVLRDGNQLLQSTLTTGGTSFTISDASSISDVTLLQVGIETVRVCNKSGNTLTVGTAAWPCSAATGGRTWLGTNGPFGGTLSWTPGVPVRFLDSITDRWRNPPSDQFKSLQPDALLSFPTGWAGMNVQFRVQNGWLDRLQTHQYNLNINGGAYTRNEVKHAARQIVLVPAFDSSTPGLRGLWVGSKPPVAEFDYNGKWCVAVGLCPHDPDLPVTLSNIDTLLNNGYGSANAVAPSWRSGNNSKCQADTLSYLGGAFRDTYGVFTRVTNDTGARADIGLMARIQALAILGSQFTGSTARELREISGSISACAGLMPIHHLEFQSSGTFCDGGNYAGNTNDKACTGANLTVGPFGKFPSLITRPLFNPSNQINSSPRFYPVGAADTNNIIANIAGAWSHLHASAFWDWAFSGNQFTRELIISQAGNFIAGSNAYPGSDNSAGNNNRHYMRGPFALINANDGARSRAWFTRDVVMGRYAAATGTPEHEYFDWVLRMNVAAYEGTYNVTDGRFYIPCPGGMDPTNTTHITHSPWCFGRATRGLNGTMLNLWPPEPGPGYNYFGSTDPNRSKNTAGSFMISYEHAVHGWAARKIPYFESFSRKLVGATFLNRTLGSTNPWTISTYQIPNSTCIPEGQDVPTCSSQTNALGTTQGFSTVANWLTASSTAAQTMTGPDSTNGAVGRSVQIHGFVRGLARATHGGSLTMQRAREVWDAFPLPAGVLDDPTFPMALYDRPAVQVQAGDTTAIIRTSTYYTSCKVGISATPFVVLDDTSDASMRMVGMAADYVATGLTASTQYYGRITCSLTPQAGQLGKGGIARNDFRFTTTASAGGAVTMSIATKAPAGATNILVEHGASSSLGSSDTGACSAGACSASIAANTGRAKFFRITYRDAGNATIGQPSSIYRRIP